MNYADLINIRETVCELFDRVGEPGESVSRDVKHTLQMLDGGVERVCRIMKKVADERARLAGLMLLLSGMPTVSVAANAPPHPAVASARVASLSHMDYADLVNIRETVSGLYNRVGESDEYVLRDVEHTLRIVDKGIERMCDTMKIVADERARLAGLTFMLSGMPTVSVVANAPAPLATVESPQVAVSPTVSHVSPTPSPIADHRAPPVPPPRPLAVAPLYQSLALRPSSPTTANKARGVDVHNKTPTTLLSRKRQRVITQRDGDSEHLSTNDIHHEFSSDFAVSANRQPTQPHVGPSVTRGVCLPVSRRSDAAHPGLAILCDSSGAEITWERLSRALQYFSFIPLDLLPAVYRMAYRCELMPPNVNCREFNLRLVKVKGFVYWLLKPEGGNSDSCDSLSILRRSNSSLKILHRNIIQLLTDRQVLTTTAPQICYYLAKLCYMRASLLTGPVLSELFTKATGQSLRSLNVVTHTGIRNMSDDELADMVKTWIYDICSYIAPGDRMQYSFDIATKCNAAHLSNCLAIKNSSVDLQYKVAQEMLASNEFDSRLFLGNSPTHLGRLYKGLVFLADKDVDEPTQTYLKRLSEKLHSQK
ncbi:hypothetical protein H4S04_004631 [Coemansia sp. S16]|nr:hypothetical protein H4S04_004631 [Coemansia sp. S16]KAJ2065402.1 hypothetical protein GGI08_002233 [Coemansia sp. S2]KAJ2066853.1 hypothetical protein GGH13_005548 [Coemansia sp. S155-1]KAJ2352847.1 hypothetical protein GGH92_001021 [Coemansia sp. RSA 2673]KAJ2426437.1 hypothetical protein GGF41_002055 [Coemansia sp. RSA 2531]